ncbi:MAG: hypothetical protein RBT11_16680 [Desulfobacterales bacterium]|nr:hypothetical protein [Desulfobacterales bacterium]
MGLETKSVRGDVTDVFLPSERRSGMDRRQFTYDAHIPERRIRRDRRQLLKTGDAVVTKKGMMAPRGHP